MIKTIKNNQRTKLKRAQIIVHIQDYSMVKKLIE